MEALTGENLTAGHAPYLGEKMEAGREGNLEKMKAFMLSRGERMEAYFLAMMNPQTGAPRLCLMAALPKELCKNLMIRNNGIEQELRHVEFGIGASDSLLSDGRIVRVAYFGLAFGFDFGRVCWTSAYNLCSSQDTPSVFDLLPSTSEMPVYAFAPTAYGPWVKDRVQMVTVSEEQRQAFSRQFPREIQNPGWSQEEFLRSAKIQLQDKSTAKNIRRQLFKGSGLRFSK